MYSALDVAKYIVSFFYEKRRPISNLKLQKMLYYVWIGFFNKTQESLFSNEICAWPLGPVVPDVYNVFCSYAGTPIPCSYDTNIAECDKVIINGVLETHLDTPASTLVDMTHRKGMPWDLIYQNGLGNRDIIPFLLIIDKECEVQ